MQPLTIHYLDTPLGPMLTVADDKALHLLEFSTRSGLNDALTRLGGHFNEGTNGPIDQIAKELELYFKGELQTFTTPIHLAGTDFQKSTWQALMDIPYGAKWSYTQQALHMGRPKAVRAVANANGRNRLAIIIPCHRVIRHGGDLGGYGGGIDKKKALLKLENQHR